MLLVNNCLPSLGIYNLIQNNLETDKNRHIVCCPHLTPQGALLCLKHRLVFLFQQQMRQKSKQQAKIEATQKLEQVTKVLEDFVDGNHTILVSGTPMPPDLEA